MRLFEEKTHRDREYQSYREDGNLTRVAVEVSNVPEVSFVELGETILLYNEISSVASGALTSIIAYAVPVGFIFALDRVDVSGENIATYQVEIDSVINSKSRTYFGNLNTSLLFNAKRLTGLKLITVKVEHSRPEVADFNATIIGRLINE